MGKNTSLKTIIAKHQLYYDLYEKPCVHDEHFLLSIRNTDIGKFHEKLNPHLSIITQVTQFSTGRQFLVAQRIQKTGPETRLRLH